MITDEDKASLRLLVQHVSRAFYEPKFIVVLDQLARHEVLKDDDLAGRMGLQLKELNKIMAVLDNDGLAQVFRRNELKDGAQRSVGRQYFYLDFQHFCNVVKWRVAHMRRTIEHGLRNELDNKGYVCPQCGKSFGTLDVDKLMDFVRQTFVCDICSGELIDNENADNVRGSQDRMQRFNWQMRYIVEGLRKTEQMVLPAFNIVEYVNKHFTTVESLQASSSEPGSGLKIAGASGAARQDEGIGIVLSADKDEETVRRERDAQAAAKRDQNVLPSWHKKSTISGHETALGIKERERIEEIRGSVVLMGQEGLDESLKGLGRVGGSSGNGVNGSGNVIHVNGISLEGKGEDIKLEVNATPDADYYDQYYASLEASAVASAQQTPLGDFASQSDDFDEDRKPNVEYLDYLNEYKKRSRSAEDVGGGDGGRKQARVVSGQNGSANGTVSHTYSSAVNGVNGNGMAHGAGEGDMSMAPTPAAGGGDGEDDPLVQVNGESIPYSAITEEHQELMTPEEYTAYWEIYTARGG